MNLPASAYQITLPLLPAHRSTGSPTPIATLVMNATAIAVCAPVLISSTVIDCPVENAKHLRMVDGHIAQCDTENEPDLCFCEAEDVILEREREEIRQEQSELHSRWLRGDL